MRALKLKKVFEMLAIGLLLLASGLSLEGCSKKKKHGPPPHGGPAQPGIYGQVGAAGCGLPQGTAQVLRSSFGYGSILTVYVVRIGPNQVQMHADVVIPSDGYFAPFSGCLSSTQVVGTYQNGNPTFENFATNTVLAGAGGQIEILGNGTTYINGSALSGTIRVYIPQSGFNGNTYDNLVGIQ